MTNASTQTGVPKLDAPIVNPDGTVSIPWYRFWIALWTRTGQSSGSPSVVLDNITNVEGSFLYRGSTQWTGLLPGAGGKVLETNGETGAPQWVDRVSSIATGTGLTGGPISTSGTITLAPAPALTLKGNNTAAPAIPTDLTVSQVKTMLQFVGVGDAAGGVLGGTYPNPGLAANVVANANLTPMAAGTVKANLTGGSANPTDSTMTSLLAALGFVPSTTGSYTLAGGLVLKWGAATGSTNVVFPVAFPTGLLGAWAVISAGTTVAGTLQSIWLTSHSATGFSSQTRQFDGTTVSDPNADFFWFALGY